MLRRIVAALVAVALGIRSAPASAGTVCPDSSSVSATFGCTYSGSYKPGQPYDYVTIWPDGQSDTLSESGIVIHVVLKDCQGAPLPGILPEVRNDSLCICPNTNHADAPTDANGRTRFTQAIAGNGWSTKLFVYADNVLVGSVPVKVNSGGPASGTDTSCTIDALDIPAFSAAFRSENGVDTNYRINSDYNEDGFVDLVDFMIFNARLGRGCPSNAAKEVRP